MDLFFQRLNVSEQGFVLCLKSREAGPQHLQCVVAFALRDELRAVELQGLDVKPAGLPHVVLL